MDQKQKRFLTHNLGGSGFILVGLVALVVYVLITRRDGFGIVSSFYGILALVIVGIGVLMFKTKRIYGEHVAEFAKHKIVDSVKTIFRKKEKFYVGRRKVTIVYATKMNETKRAAMVDAIKEVFEKSEVAKKFRSITFVITRKDPDKHGLPEGEEFHYAGYVEPKEMLFRRFVAYMNANSFDEYTNLNELKRQAYSTAEHELAHLWHGYISTTFKEQVKISSRLAENIWVRLPYVFNKKNRLSDRRDQLMYFITNLPIEGIAVFYQKREYVDLDNEPLFIELYDKAENAAENMIFSFNRYLTNIRSLIKDKNRIAIYPDDKLIPLLPEDVENYKRIDKEMYEYTNKSFRTDVYNIGYHMVYTILYRFTNLELEDIAKMSHIEFIRKYGQAMKIAGRKPIVTLNGGEGIIDYNKLLAFWYDTCKLVEKYGL